MLSQCTARYPVLQVHAITYETIGMHACIFVLKGTHGARGRAALIAGLQMLPRLCMLVISTSK